MCGDDGTDYVTIWHRPESLFFLLAAPCVGSFLGVLIERLTAGRPVVLSRSACPHCGERLAARDLIPLFSWVANRARCRFCHARISAFYPTVELLALIVAVWALAVVPGWLAWVTCGLGWVLLALAVIDWKHLFLPDSLSLPLIPAGLLVAWGVSPDELPSHAIGAAVGFVLLWGIAELYRRMRRREGLGLGDAKLLAAAGAWLGWQGLPSVVLIAAAAGLAAALVQARWQGALDGKRPVPFGPYLAVAFWLVWLYGPLGPS